MPKFIYNVFDPNYPLPALPLLKVRVRVGVSISLIFSVILESLKR
jgi:hypothetical protein